MLDKHVSHLILLACSVVNVVPMTVLLGMTLGGITTLDGALAVVMAVWPLVMGIGAFILHAHKKPGLFLYENNPDEQATNPSRVRLCTLLIVVTPFFALGIAAAVLLLRDEPTHAALALAITLTVLAVVMHVLLHVYAAKEEPTALFKPKMLNSSTTCHYDQKYDLF
jgi:hypothetical protein